MEIVEDLHHTDDISLFARYFKFYPNLIYRIRLSCSMRFQKFIERHSLDPSAVHSMDSNTISSCLSDDFLSWLRFTLMTEIIIDQRVSIYHDCKIFLEIFQITFYEFRTDIRLLFLCSDLFGIDGFYELRIGLFFIKNSY